MRRLDRPSPTQLERGMNHSGTRQTNSWNQRQLRHRPSGENPQGPMAAPHDLIPDRQGGVADGAASDKNGDQFRCAQLRRPHPPEPLARPVGDGELTNS
jgi:hypothetical protein